MTLTSPRKRLCQVILGAELKAGQKNTAVISIPLLHEDIDRQVLFAAHEAIYSYTPQHVRQVLPFVLHAIEDQKIDDGSIGFIDTFLLHINYEFALHNNGSSVQVVDEKIVTPLRYSTEYRQNWTANTISAMNSFEHGWAYDWVCELLETQIPDEELFLRQDLTMFARILGMALRKHVNEVPAFRI
jgi:hypothetical protein